MTYEGEMAYQRRLELHPDRNKNEYRRKIKQDPDYNKKRYQREKELYPNLLKTRRQRFLEQHPDYDKIKYKRTVELHGRDKINENARNWYHNNIDHARKISRKSSKKNYVKKAKNNAK